MSISRSNIGEVLVSMGEITQEKLDIALQMQQKNGGSLADALVDSKACDGVQIAKARAKMTGYEFISVRGLELPEAIVKLVKGADLRKHNVCPIRFADENNSVLVLAMADPLDMNAQDDIMIITGCQIEPKVAAIGDINALLDKYYGSEEAMNAVEKFSKERDAKIQALNEMREKEDADINNSPIVLLVKSMFEQAVRKRASDIHIDAHETQVVVRFRIDGSLYERTAPAKDAVNAIISRIKILSRLDIAEKRLPQDGSFTIRYQNRSIEVRVSVCPAVYGEKLVLRILDKGTGEMNIDKLGFEPQQKKAFLEAANLPHGLIFLTGPTGSGKSTTLNAVLTSIRTPELNFMTLEDPVEYKLAGISQVQVKPAIGLTFAAGLRSFLRQDPDVILVGEVRDNETAEACLKAALTGHLVLSTLHTNDALGAVPRLIDMGMEPFLLANSLALVAAQRLVRILCPYCKVPHIPDNNTLSKIVQEGHLNMRDQHTWTFFKSVGCPKCFGTGYSGRRAIYEVYRMTEEMRNIIYKTQDLIELRKAAVASGALNLRANGWHKVVRGQTTIDEILSVTTADE